MKKILIGLFIVILALAGGAYFLLGDLNSFVKSQIEKHGSSALQTKVQVSTVNIKLLDGLGEINGFSVANPEGFSKSTAIGFDTLRLDLSTENMTKMPIIIDEILIDSLSSLYELNAQAKGNLNVLLEQLTSGSTASDSGSEASSEKSDIRIVIKKLVVKDTKLALDLTALGDQTYTETLPTFAVNNIGGTQGLAPEALGQAIGKSLLNNIIKQAKEKQKEKLADKVKDKALEKLEEKGGEKLKGLLDRFGS